MYLQIDNFMCIKTDLNMKMTFFAHDSCCIFVSIEEEDAVNGLVQERRNSIANARLFALTHQCTVWYRTKFGSQNLATKFGNHLCMATKIGSQC